MAWFSTAIDLIRKLDHMLLVETKHADLIESLRERVAKLEAERKLLITEAKAVATSSASMMAGQHMADLARRIGALEERTRSRTSPHRGRSPAKGKAEH